MKDNGVRWVVTTHYISVKRKDEGFLKECLGRIMSMEYELDHVSEADEVQESMDRDKKTLIFKCYFLWGIHDLEHVNIVRK